MSCLLVSDMGDLIVTADGLNTCTGYVLVTPDQYRAQVGALSEFDKDLANEYLGFMLLTFFAGHSLGRIVRWLGRR
ncbi:hypothetical protein O23A_p1402 [Aeromonas salmonicida]|nr:hypothetical protein O23A_p1402 [Aeromonas salmonicida]